MFLRENIEEEPKIRYGKLTALRKPLLLLTENTIRKKMITGALLLKKQIITLTKDRPKVFTERFTIILTTRRDREHCGMLTMRAIGRPATVITTLPEG